MYSLLIKMNETIKQEKLRGRKYLNSKFKYLLRRYYYICKGGKYYYSSMPTIELKKLKGKNLLDRLIKYKDETLRFFKNFNVPFTNNLAERDLRMAKVKEKILGTFASFKGGEIFARIRGYISTLKKNHKSVLKELNNVLKNKPFIQIRI